MHSRASTALGALIMFASGYGVVTAWAWPWKAALFPLAIGVPVFLLAAAEVAWGLTGRHARRDDVAKDFQLSAHLPEKETLRRTGVAIGWILAFFAGIVLLGFPIAVPLFVFLFLKVQGQEGWLFAAMFAAAIWALFYGLFDRLLHLPLPPGWMQDWLGLS